MHSTLLITPEMMSAVPDQSFIGRQTDRIPLQQRVRSKADQLKALGTPDPALPNPKRPINKVSYPKIRTE